MCSRSNLLEYSWDEFGEWLYEHVLRDVPDKPFLMSTGEIIRPFLFSLWTNRLTTTCGVAAEENEVKLSAIDVQRRAVFRSTHIPQPLKAAVSVTNCY
jgi:hypothetical protein